jgi:hypothetical protein
MNGRKDYFRLADQAPGTGGRFASIGGHADGEQPRKAKRHVSEMVLRLPDLDQAKSAVLKSLSLSTINERQSIDWRAIRI